MGLRGRWWWDCARREEVRVRRGGGILELRVGRMVERAAAAIGEVVVWDSEL